MYRKKKKPIKKLKQEKETKQQEMKTEINELKQQNKDILKRIVALKLKSK